MLRAVRRARWLLLFVFVNFCAARASADVELPAVDQHAPIVVSAAEAHRWTQGDYEVWLLRGDCQVRQGATVAQGREAVVWIRRDGEFGARQNMAISYFEGQVKIDSGADAQASEPTARLTDGAWLGRFQSTAPVQIRVPRILDEPRVKPPIHGRALALRDPAAAPGAIQRTQFTDFSDSAPPADSLPVGTRRLRAFPRYLVRPQVDWFTNPTGDESIAVITGGVNLIVDGLPNFGSIDVSADRIVVWTSDVLDRALDGETLQREETPLEIYMEGDIVFRQGERVIRARQMYYDVNNHRGIVLTADVLTPAPGYQGLLRLKADVLRQTEKDRFFAENAFLTSSRLGRPDYRLQAGDVYFEDNQTPLVDPVTGEPRFDPLTGQPVVDHDRLATSYNNLLFLREIPVLYWPVLATNLEKPTYYINSAQLKNDRIFGTQVLTEFDAYQVFGITEPPEGTDWSLSADYLSERGLGLGTRLQYDRWGLFDWPGANSGFIDAWAIDDREVDNLGSDRSSLIPDKDFRHRILARHRHELPADFRLSAEFGWVSDRNFLEQYYETEWDELKDQSTGLELKQLRDNRSLSVTADLRLNEFFTQTEWLPRVDHFWLGQPLAADYLTWYAHSQAGFARLRVADAPSDPVDLAKFGLLPWESARTGERAATRQEVDLPLPLGPVKVVPYALGELAHWGEDLTGDDLQRAYGQVGLRASIPFWAANPWIESQLMNVHGLAHKVVFDGELSYADADRDLTALPLYDSLDDDSVEHFRRRFAFNTFGGAAPVPARFDERFYALRSGLGGWVTSPSTEIADDLTALRLGMRHRWQTKRGAPGERRIIDWIVLDTNVSWFPEADRDNFGEELGLWDYDFRWHVGDRLTLVSSGVFDFFDAGQGLVSIGGFLNRPTLGSLYLGYRSLDGPIDSEVVQAAYTLRMSRKWISTVSTSIDIGGAGNIGQHVALTRIGESFLVSLGFNVDANKDNVGASIMVEPRFLPSTRLGRVGGAPIPVAGIYGLE